VAGTRVYEDKRQESVKVIEETGNHSLLLALPSPLAFVPRSFFLVLFSWILEQKREKINEYLG
jgi:hypothetical protein